MVFLYYKMLDVNKGDLTIDLVLIDPESVGKRTHDLMDTVNAKKRWKTIYFYYFGKERVILNINDINDFSFFGTPECHQCCSTA
jgi:hypothetical protein